MSRMYTNVYLCLIPGKRVLKLQVRLSGTTVQYIELFIVCCVMLYTFNEFNLWDMCQSRWICLFSINYIYKLCISNSHFTAMEP